MLSTLALMITALVPLQSPVDTGYTAHAADTAGSRVSVSQAPIIADSLLRYMSDSTDTIPRRRRAIEYSEWYARRLEIHRIGSYVMLPLFATEYVLGQRLINGADRHSTVGSAHALAAGGIGVLFTVNTVTGLWNLWDARSDPADRTRRTLHAVIMLAADAGFVATGAVAGNAKHSSHDAQIHRNVALGSIGISTIGTAMMWLWKN
jgi:hypothetical protein